MIYFLKNDPKNQYLKISFNKNSIRELKKGDLDNEYSPFLKDENKIEFQRLYNWFVEDRKQLSQFSGKNPFEYSEWVLKDGEIDQEKFYFKGNDLNFVKEVREHLYKLLPNVLSILNNQDQEQFNHLRKIFNFYFSLRDKKVSDKKIKQIKEEISKGEHFIETQ